MIAGQKIWDISMITEVGAVLAMRRYDDKGMGGRVLMPQVRNITDSDYCTIRKKKWVRCGTVILEKSKLCDGLRQDGCDDIRNLPDSVMRLGVGTSHSSLRRDWFSLTSEIGEAIIQEFLLSPPQLG